ncbi:hypothetical protein LEP1GSC170_1050 [Leptospira interrogans serovar Bataviae str. HAI135]|nr:hypothetical protein LEP1GSC170_1050 [Leptospira interrogans serovar Bataviae str. HAI135]
MNRLFFVFFLFLFLNQSIKAETYSLINTITEIKRFFGDPATVEKYWLLESIPVWQKEEESRLEIYLKKYYLSNYKNKLFLKKRSLKQNSKKFKI